MKRLCVIGDPVEHSLSPVMHNAAIRSLRLEGEFEYGRRRVSKDELGAFIGSMRDGSISGASVTMPHKEAVMPFLDGLTEEARSCQAVNTVYSEDGRVFGHNTDGEGFFRALAEAGVAVRGKKVLLMGAGGAAKAVALSLAVEQPESLYILNRNIRRAEELRMLLPVAVNVSVGGFERLEEAVTGSDLIINTTPVGMKQTGEDDSPVPANLINDSVTVMDIVYDPIETRLLREAKDKGARTVDGLGMLVHQGAAQFEIFTGKRAPADVMREALIRFLSEA